QNMMVGARYNGEEITPRINAWLREEGMLYFDHFYQQVASGNTSDAEFAMKNSNMGVVESYTYQIYDENHFRGLPRLLSEIGYKNMVMHGYDKSFWNRENMYRSEGIDRFYGDVDYVNDRIEGIGGGNISGISDEAFYAQSVDILEAEREKGPFFGMLISLSSHHPFALPAELREIEILPEDEGSTFGNYVNSIRYADRCFGGLIDRLKENGLYEESLIVVYGDHQGLIKSDEYAARWNGRYDYDTMMNIPLLIHIPGSRAAARTSHTAGGQIDLLPTMAWLMGFESLDTLYLGQNLLTATEGFVPEKTHLLKGSFIKDDLAFEMSRDGVFAHSRAWNTNTGEAVPIEGLEADYLRAKRMIETGEFYLREDVLRKIYLEGRSFADIVAEAENASVFPREIEMVRLVKDRAEMLLSSDRSLAMYTPEELMARLTENPEERLMVYAQDALSTLEAFDERFSGRAVNRGVRYIADEAAAARYAEAQTRMIPLIRDPADWTKVEYLGYINCALFVASDDYSPERLDAFLKTVGPKAVVLRGDFGDFEAPDFARVLGQVGFLYAYKPESVLAYMRMRAAFSIEIDGFVTQRSPWSPFFAEEGE
ncbi:MAG: LTA synthase family protein, partial [Clostridiales Family XIII bacterium]|nr:LTA synthase family protein [Clostridiales Family XIII bacterium]